MRHKIVLGTLVVVLLLVSAIGMWIYWAPTTRIDREERELLNDMKRVPDWLFDCTCTNKQAFIDNVFLRIVRLSSERLEEDVDRAPQILLEGRNGRRKYVQSL